MKRLFYPAVGIIFTLFVFLLLQGCTINYVVSKDEANPYPNAWRVEMRVRAQLNRVSAALQQGKINQDTADILAQNDALIRRIMREDQGPADSMADLDAEQATLLNNLLTDNDRTIDDAIRRFQAWASYFQTGSYDYRFSDPIIYNVYIDYRINQQITFVNTGLDSSQLTPAQATELKARIQAVRDLKENYYKENGRFDLSEEQVNQLSRMAEDNDRFIRFRLKGSRGKWDRTRFLGWKKQNPEGLEEGASGSWGRRREMKKWPTATPVPYQPAPINTFTPVPAAPVPTSTPRPLIPTFTSTPRPQAAPPTPTQVPVVHEEPVFTSTSKPIPPTFTPTQVHEKEKQEPTKVSETEKVKETKGGEAESSDKEKKKHKWGREGDGHKKAKEVKTPVVDPADKNTQDGEGGNKDSVDSNQPESDNVEGDQSDSNSKDDKGEGKHRKKPRDKNHNRNDD